MSDDVKGSSSGVRIDLICSAIAVWLAVVDGFVLKLVECRRRLLDSIELYVVAAGLVTPELVVSDAGHTTLAP